MLRRLALETWAALWLPRRAIPIAAVAAPLLVAQALWNADPVRGALAGALLAAGAVLVAPVAWRATAANANPALYAAIGLATAALCGVVLPRAGGFEDRFLTALSTLPFVAGVMLAAGWALGRDVDAEILLQTEQRRRAELERQRDHAALLALRAHLDPHFLFNTLNAIAEWCATDPAIAERAILRLAGVLRTLLGAIDTPEWPLDRELGLAVDVLELYRARDPERFAFDIQVAEAARGVPVPAMLLLPLIENAVRHGPGAGHPGRVSLEVALVPLDPPNAGGTLRITVRNPGAYAGPRPGGRGLDLVRQRLIQAYGDRASLSISAEGAASCAVVAIPASG